MQTMIVVANGDTLAAIRGFLKSLLERGVVEALMVPMRERNGAVTQRWSRSQDSWTTPIRWHLCSL